MRKLYIYLSHKEYSKKGINIFSKHCDPRYPIISGFQLPWYLLLIAVLFLLVNVNNVQPEVIIRESDSIFASSGNARNTVSSISPLS